jgi:DNA-directed RNA polymerase specialized sigma24 family protein
VEHARAIPVKDSRPLFRASEEEREAFGLVRLQGLTQTEAAEVLAVSPKTVQRRLNRARLLLAEELDDLRPSHA